MPKSKFSREIHLAEKANIRCFSLGADPRGNIEGTAPIPMKRHTVTHGNNALEERTGASTVYSSHPQTLE